MGALKNSSDSSVYYGNSCRRNNYLTSKIKFNNAPDFSKTIGSMTNARYPQATKDDIKAKTWYLLFVKTMGDNANQYGITPSPALPLSTIHVLSTRII